MAAGWVYRDRLPLDRLGLSFLHRGSEIAWLETTVRTEPPGLPVSVEGSPIEASVGGVELDYIRGILTKEMALSIQREETGARVFQAIGEFAPAFGMFGTLVGLVQMLSSMSDPTTIGRGMAVALLTTLYGVLMANLIGIPIAEKLEAKSEQERATRSLIIECVFQIQQKQNPTSIREILEPYLPEKQRQVGGGDAYTGGSEAETKAEARKRLEVVK